KHGGRYRSSDGGKPVSNREVSGNDSPLSPREPASGEAVHDSPQSPRERDGGEGFHHHQSEPSLGHEEFRKVPHGPPDLLQLVYSMVAIVRSRLPESALQERDLIKPLRLRAEVCKSLVDNVQDYLCPIAISPEQVNLSEICTSLILDFKERLPGVDWRLVG